jgi:hypothetical protein
MRASSSKITGKWLFVHISNNRTPKLQSQLNSLSNLQTYEKISAFSLYGACCNTSGAMNPNVPTTVLAAELLLSSLAVPKSDSFARFLLLYN